MKKIVVALTVLAGITFLSGCAYDWYGPRVGYSSYYQPGFGRIDCVHHWNATFCG